MDGNRLRVAAAANLAAWHDVSVRALGWHPVTTDAWWSCATPAPNIYHSAVSLRPATGRRDRERVRSGLRVHLDDPAGMSVSVCDCWDELELDRLGLTRRARSVWSARSPAPLPLADRHVRGLVIDRVTDCAALIEFEQTVVRGFGARQPIAPFDIHGPAILDDPVMHLFLGRAEDAAEPVAVAMAFVSPSVLGIYGVATVPGARGRGYATAMTAEALSTDLSRPAVLQPSPAAHALYRRLGFTDIGEFSHWTT